MPVVEEIGAISQNFGELARRLGELEGLVKELAEWTGFRAPVGAKSQVYTGAEQGTDNHTGRSGVGVARKSTRGIPRKSKMEIQEETKMDLEEEVIFKIEVDSPEDLGDFDDFNGGDLEEDFNQDPLFSPADAEESDSDWKNAEIKLKPSKSRRSKKKASRYPPLQMPPSIPDSGPFVAMSKLPASELPLLPCPYCPSTFLKSDRNLRLHLKRFHGGPSPLLCPHCPKNSPWRDTLHLNNHIRQNHSEVPPPPSQFQCTLCSKTCRTISSFKRHLKMHKTPRKTSDRTLHQCPHCPSKLTSRIALNGHLRTHTGERPFKCPHCPYAANLKATLNNHVHNIHSGIGKEIMCDKCPKRYKTLKSLRWHLKAHLRVNWKCYFCQREFNNVGNLRQHMGKHTAEKPPRRFRWDNYREQEEKEREAKNSIGDEPLLEFTQFNEMLELEVPVPVGISGNNEETGVDLVKL